MNWTKATVNLIYQTVGDRQQACDYLLAALKTAFDGGQITAGNYLMLRQYIFYRAYN
ncbi:MAG: hypothetical protein LIO45_06030 [Clostridiales bacterium]|nr:hypothetical protein [Clostridiales bacterium]